MISGQMWSGLWETGNPTKAEGQFKSEYQWNVSFIKGESEVTLAYQELIDEKVRIKENSEMTLD